MAEKSNTNVYWYIVSIFLVVIFVVSIQQYTSSMLRNPQINNTLTNESIQHILRIQGIDVSDFEVTKDQLEDDPAYDETNDTGSQAKDTALEFFYSRSKASGIGVIAANVLSLPSFIVTLLNIPENSISWLISILNWFWRIMLVLAVYYFIKGVK